MVYYLDTKALGTNQEKMVGYAWRISNLEIFDIPKELSEFYTKQKIFIGMNNNGFDSYLKVPLTKAPQSWGYIEV